MVDDKKLGHAIIATVTYYDVLSYPMTVFEIWRHLVCLSDEGGMCWSLADVRFYIKKGFLSEYIAQKNGMYFLIGREDLVPERRTRERISTAKIRQLIRVVRVLRWVPFVKMIALTGRLSYKNGTRKSDLDVLIALSDGHIWTGRTLVTIITQIMGMRRHGNKQVDRVCLNYYISDKHLTVPTQDLFAAHEYSMIVPLYGMDVFDRFVIANHAWISAYKPHHMRDVLPSTWTVEDHVCARGVRRISEWLFGWRMCESYLRKLQQKKIQNNPNTALPGACIIANDRHLVFLPRPHGPEVFEEYHKRLSALSIKL